MALSVSADAQSGRISLRPAGSTRSSWFSGEPRVAHLEPSETVAEPVDVEWWGFVPRSAAHRARSSRWQRAISMCRRRPCDFAESRAQLGIARAAGLPHHRRQRFLRAGEGERQGRVLQPFDGRAEFKYSSGPDRERRVRQQCRGSDDGPPTSRRSISIQYGFDAAWELDLSGQVSALGKSARMPASMRPPMPGAPR